jgi:Tfp pilus assembly protein PilP
MKRYPGVIVASVLAVVIAVVLVVRVSMRKRHFDQTVREALSTSEGYDQRFIKMVKNLEEHLARQASFGYTGGKDPMTGKVRRVVQPRRAAPRRPRKQAPVAEVDPVKLTAIIFDDVAGEYTAVIMDGERSYSVEVGDRIRNRRITRITEDAVLMISDTMMYRYDIYGRSAKKKR